MYVAHPSRELSDLFACKPYQGVAPEQATFLFVGLDANYDEQIATRPIFSKVLEYHSDGVAFWRRHGVHHPFLLPEYTGDGRLYHRSFARIGFKPEQADLVSFIKLLHVPTVGRNVLVPDDLALSHLKMLKAVILDGHASHIFVPAGVARLMRATGLFPGLSSTPIEHGGPLSILFRVPGKIVYSHLHFSVYGKFQQQKEAEASAMRGLLPSAG